MCTSTLPVISSLCTRTHILCAFAFSFSFCVRAFLRTRESCCQTCYWLPEAIALRHLHLALTSCHEGCHLRGPFAGHRPAVKPERNGWRQNSRACDLSSVNVTACNIFLSLRLSPLSASVPHTFTRCIQNSSTSSSEYEFEYVALKC